MPGLVYVEDDEEGGPGHWRWSEGNHSLVDEEKSESPQEEGKGEEADTARDAAFTELPSARSFRTGPRGESSPSFASSVLQRSKTTPSAGSQLERRASKREGTKSPTIARAKSNTRSKPTEKTSQENREKEKSVRVGNEIVRSDSIRHLRDAFEEMDVDGNGYVDKMNFMEFISHHRDLFGWLGEESSDITEAIAKWVDSIFQRQGMPTFTFKDVLRVLYPSAKNAEIDRLEQLVGPPGRATVFSTSLSNAEEQDIEAVSVSSFTCFDCDNDEREKDVGRMPQIFNSIDDDGNGELDKFEFREFMRRLGFTETSESDQIFEEIDKDCGGTIDVEELKVWWQKHLAS